MDFQKDYYATLGCAPNADQSVIQAAYRALAKKYHPDANQGSEESKSKFQEIQEAYEVLSDPTKRAYYDSMRAGKGGREYAPGEEYTEGSDAGDTELQKRWDIVKEYYADVDQMAVQLGRISPNLKLIFQIILLDTKAFKEARQIERNIEDIYLTRYFGENGDIKSFAKKLLLHKNLYQHADALRELNKTISVLGLEAPSEVIIHRLREKYNLDWTKGDIPFQSGEKTLIQKTPDTEVAWRAIQTLAPLYGWKPLHGWKYLSGCFGTTFMKLTSNETIRCFSPEEAREQMGIPLELVVKKLEE